MLLKDVSIPPTIVLPRMLVTLKHVFVSLDVNIMFAQLMMTMNVLLMNVILMDLLILLSLILLKTVTMKMLVPLTLVILLTVVTTTPTLFVKLLMLVLNLTAIPLKDVSIPISLKTVIKMINASLIVAIKRTDVRELL